MKPSKKNWLILTIGILIIACASLVAVRSQQVHEHERLTEELSLAELRLDGSGFEQLLSQQEELEEQLSQTKSQFEATNAIFPQPIGSIAFNDTLFDIAETCGAEVIEISSSGPVSGNLEGIACHVQTLTTRVEGDVTNLISFITHLIDNLTNGVVKSVEISIPKDTGAKKPSANIKLAIYSYQGD